MGMAPPRLLALACIGPTPLRPTTRRSISSLNGEQTSAWLPTTNGTTRRCVPIFIECQSVSPSSLDLCVTGTRSRHTSAASPSSFTSRRPAKLPWRLPAPRLGPVSPRTAALRGLLPNGHSCRPVSRTPQRLASTQARTRAMPCHRPGNVVSVGRDDAPDRVGRRAISGTCIR